MGGSTLDKIPSKWRLSSKDLERAPQQRDITGSFIEQFLDEETISITSLKTVRVLKALSERQLTATRVVTAFCQRASVAHQINNCLHEIFFDQALGRARYLDDYYAENGKPLGPLHGLPISLKDQFHVKGVDTTMGYVGWIGRNLGITDPDKTHKVESQIVSELLSLGGVFFCKTSLPQTLLFGETKNNIIGQTLNPINQGLSCGGSSGGEAALMALGGSSIGVGTDIGGSLRIPAGFCGYVSVNDWIHGHGGFLSADGEHDVHQHLDQSGEPLIPDLQDGFKLKTPTELLNYQDLTLQGLEYERGYSDYWNATGESDGQVVDAVLMPVAPHAAAIPGKFYHGAYTDAMNLTDYTVVVIPTVRADKKVDVFDEGYEPLGDTDIFEGGVR
ncbi:general amidase [Fusarium beomiforme]|uniref:amidase n=1 Tax=Fusarium beomiforme TaxID=44412 RepID=A0A9P5AEE6_9HYPO|nr:general amidase [Fusarium beomiforme]